MKIDLEYPYSAEYQAGYIYVNNEARRCVTLKDSHGATTGTTYARYLMAVKLGRFLTDQEEVDHIDNNKTNDDPNNLQILTPEQNREKREKHYLNNVQQKFDLECPNCGKSFTLTEREMGGRITQIQKNGYTGLIYCSRSCSSIFNKILKPGNFNSGVVGLTIAEDQIQRIKSLKRQGFSSYKISEQLGIARNTVMKYW